MKNSKILSAISRVTLLVCCGLPLVVNAQEQKELPDSQFNALDHVLQRPAPARLFPEKKFGDHLFITAEGGMTFVRKTPDNLWRPQDKPGFRYGLSVGDWVTPVHGWRVGLFGGHQPTTNHFDPTYFGVSADYLLNLTSLAMGYKEKRPFELIASLGGEYQRLHSSREKEWTNAGGVRFGLQARFNVSKSTFLFVEPRFSVMSDRLDGERSWERYDWQSSVMFGLGYKVNGSGHIRRTVDREAEQQDFLRSNRYMMTFGAGMFMDDNSFSHDYAFYGGLGKWFSKSSGFRLGLDWELRNRQVKFMTLNVDVDYLLSLSTLIAGFNPDRVFDLTFVPGLQIGASHFRAANHFNFGMKVGLEGRFNVSRSFEIFLQPAFLAENMPGYEEKTLRPQFRLMAGLTYKIGGNARKASPYAYLAEKLNFVSIAGGVGMTDKTFVHPDMWRATPGFEVAIGRRTSRCSAFQLAYSFDNLNLPHQKGTNISTLHIDYMLDLMQWLEYKPGRKFAIAPRIGFGAAWSSESSQTGFGGIAGLRFAWKLPQNFGIYFEPSMTLWEGKMCDSFHTTHNYTGVGRLNVGASYSF